MHLNQCTFSKGKAIVFDFANEEYGIGIFEYDNNEENEEKDEDDEEKEKYKRTKYNEHWMYWSEQPQKPGRNVLKCKLYVSRAFVNNT